MEKEHWEYISHLMVCQEKQIKNSLIMDSAVRTSELNKINVIHKYVDSVLNVGVY
tara:strand:- start:5105 stop:5269 length:165 start_codon:yes stop_codon:yes gene_type:complete